MTHYNLVLYTREVGHNGQGFTDIIQAVSWGLRAAGHTVSYSENKFAVDCQNIIFSIHVASWEIIQAIPRGSIVYNLEQFARHAASGYGKDIFEYFVKNFEIWDYSADNLVLWQLYGPVYPVSIVPVGYAPIMTRIPKQAEQEIDVLIYGVPTEPRVLMFRKLCAEGLRVMFLYGFYGELRDYLIARSKVILNIGQYDRTFEIVRASFLMANSKAIVADVYENITIEQDIAHGVMFVPLEHVLTACLRLAADAPLREALEQRAFKAIVGRNMAVIMDKALKRELIAVPAITG